MRQSSLRATLAVKGAWQDRRKFPSKFLAIGSFVGAWTKEVFGAGSLALAGLAVIFAKLFL